MRHLNMAFALLTLTSAFADDQPTPSELTAMEAAANQPGTRVAWANEVARIETPRAKAVVTAVVLEPPSQPQRPVRGIRIDLAEGNVTDRVYVGEEHGDRLVKSLDEVAAGIDESLSRPTAYSRCFGSCLFLTAMRQRAHFFSASQCAMSDGWFGLSVFTGVTSFRFTDLGPSPFANAIGRALAAVRQH